MKIKITHLTSVHPRYDTRIFLKECSSLANSGEFHVSLVVADSNGDEVKNGIYIYDVGKIQGRISRIFRTTNKVYEKALALDSDIYHMHDPELIPVGVRLKKQEKKVIFDAHEDLPKQLLSKPYLNKSALWTLSKVISLYEGYACRKLDAVVAATPNIREKFLDINVNAFDVNNFPILGELSSEVKWADKKDEVCYVGGITKIRGIKEVIKSLEYLDGVNLNLVGEFSEIDVENEVKKYPSWEAVNATGFLDRLAVQRVLANSKAGLVTLFPTPNHVDSQPIKMFEYMSAGLPVVASNFPLWKEIVEGNKCGICVDPLNPQAIADAIKYLITHPKEAELMGKNGQQAVTTKYNWGVEEKKLLEIYAGILR